MSSATRLPPMMPNAGTNSSLRVAVSDHRLAVRFGLLDILFWAVMFLINVQEILELRGIDTIYKPYRVVSLGLAVLVLPALLRQWRMLRPFMLPLLLALGYAVLVTGIRAGLEGLVAIIPLVATSVALLFCASAVSSRWSLYVGCYAYLAGFILSTILGYLSEGTEGRFSGLFHNPNYYGFAASIGIIFIMSPSMRLSNFIRFTFIAMAAAFVFMSGSRSSLAALFLSFMTQVIANPRLFRFLLLLSAIALPFALVWESGITDLSKFNQVAVRRYSIDEINRGGKGRLALAQAGLDVAAKTWFTGIGIDQFRLKYFTRYFFVYSVKGEVLQLGIHNVYVATLTEWGLPALILLGYLTVLIYTRANKIPEFKIWIRGFLITILVSGMAGNTIGTAHFWLIYGFMLQLFRFGNYQNPHSPTIG